MAGTIRGSAGHGHGPFLTAPRGPLPRGRQRGGPRRGRGGFLGASPETSRARGVLGDQPPGLTLTSLFLKAAPRCRCRGRSRAPRAPPSRHVVTGGPFRSWHWSAPFSPSSLSPPKGATGMCLVDVPEYIPNFEKHVTVGVFFW